MFGFKAQRQFRSAMSLDDGSVHKNQTNKIVAITFPIISKTWSFLKPLAIQTKQSTVTLAAIKNFIQCCPVTFKFSGKLVGCAKLEFRTFGRCKVKKCWFSSCWTNSLFPCPKIVGFWPAGFAENSWAFLAHFRCAFPCPKC